jgi:hypothetical protein
VASTAKAGRTSLWVACTIAAAVVFLLTRVSGSLASETATSRQDVKATHEYLLAWYVYDKKVLAHAAQTIGDLESLAGRLERECPDVLAGVPIAALPNVPEARESELEEEDLMRLDGELDELEIAVELQPDHLATRSLERTMAGLRWSDPLVTRLARERVEVIGRVALGPEPDICADADAWVASDYTKLSPATIALTKPMSPPPVVPPVNLDTVLKRYEDPADEAILWRTRSLSAGHPRSRRVLERLVERIPVVLGLPQS